MKRLIAMGGALLFAVLVLGAAVAVTRPEWLPAQVRRVLPPALASVPSPGEEAGLYCKEHGVPEKFCTICHEELKKSLLLCNEHDGIPEAICTVCHPEVKDQYNIQVCQAHGLPEHFCARCGNGPGASNSIPDDGWCATHRKPEALCLECKLNPGSHDATTDALGAKVCRKPLPMVRLASAQLARQVGIETAEVTQEEHAHSLEANAETAYDANHFADVTPRVAGFLREVRADLGKTVKQGEVLAVVDSAEVSGVKAQYITAKAAMGLAQATYERTKTLAQSGSVAAKAELEALTALNQAKASALDAGQKLRNFGFDEPQLDQIIKEDDTSSVLNIVAPLDGMVVVRHAVKGEPVQATTQLFSVTDTSRVWLWIDVYESDLAAVQPGQKVSFVVSGQDSAVYSGEVNWIGAEVSQQTRTTRVRAELANPNGRIRANQFGQAVIQVGEPHTAIVVPRAAVQRDDGVDVVFLPMDEPGVYRPQRVVTQSADRADVLEATWGLTPGQRVVTRGAFLLKTEIMKGAIGAGCCE